MYMQNHENVQKSTSWLRNSLGSDFKPEVGLIFGSGLGGFASQIRGGSIPYADIPGFPVSTVEGHAGALLHGEVSGKKVLALSGRFHLYEGYTAAEAVTGVRVMAELGIKSIIITNAAGALNTRYSVGDLMLITDHINHTGQSPLTGLNNDGWGVRFPDQSQVWDPKLGKLAAQAALREQLRLERGVYVQVSGPELETPAETRMYKRLGADAVGMSTAIEAIAANHMGVKVTGFSCLTNKNLRTAWARRPIRMSWLLPTRLANA